VVVVGDVQAQEVYKLAKQHFGKLSTKKLPVRKPQVEPAQLGERRVVVKAPAKQA
jgi:zinc protease